MLTWIVFVAVVVVVVVDVVVVFTVCGSVQWAKKLAKCARSTNFDARFNLVCV